MTNEFSALITDNCAYLKLVSSIFYILPKESISKIVKKRFVFYQKRSLRSQYIQFFVIFFPSFPQFPDSKSQMKLEEL